MLNSNSCFFFLMFQKALVESCEWPWTLPITETLFFAVISWYASEITFELRRPGESKAEFYKNQTTIFMKFQGIRVNARIGADLKM